MLVIPSIDIAAGRSRLVFWPGVASGTGAPTDRPERIARRFAEMGASILHVVDFDGARAGEPRNLEAIGRIAGEVAIPIQVAGGLEGPDNIRLAFAAGATRAVLAMGVVDQPDLVRECLAVAGDWLAVGLDPRPERFAAFPWRQGSVPSLEDVVGDLVELGVHRLVLAHGGSLDEGSLAALVTGFDVDILVAGGVSDLAAIRRLRDAGAAGVILGEPLLSGAIDYPAALEAAA